MQSLSCQQAPLPCVAVLYTANANRPAASREAATCLSFWEPWPGPWPFPCECLYSSYRHLGVQVWARCVPAAPLYHQRAQGTGWLGREEECGCAPALLLGVLSTSWVAVFEGTETLPVFLSSLFALLEAPEPLFAALFHLLWHHGRAVKSPGFYRCLTCLCLYQI